MQGSSVGVVGAGAWGTALAIVAARAGHRTVLWMRDGGAAAALAATRQNAARLPGVPLPEAIRPTAQLAELAVCSIVLLATPAQSTRAVATAVAPHLAAGTRTVITAKGIEQASGRLLVEVLGEVDSRLEPLVLSGPSFASDVARGLPTAVTLAARSLQVAEPVAAALRLATFRPYLSDDLTGVQIGGAVKNVLAIACGIVAGRGLGESARAALIARAFAELSRFGRVLGARPETLAGLSGLGDLVLTCSSPQSRNYAMGLALGGGRSLAEAGSGSRGLSEGAFTAAAVARIATAHGVDMPISTAVDDILAGRAGIDQVIERLLHRPLKAED